MKTPPEWLSNLDHTQAEWLAAMLERQAQELLAYAKRQEGFFNQWEAAKRRTYGPTKKQIRDAKKLDRQAQVMRLAARGWTNKQIAARLGCHPSTVSRIVQAGKCGKN